MSKTLLLRDAILLERDQLLGKLRASKQLDKLRFEIRHPLFSQIVLGMTAPDINREPFAANLWQELALLAQTDERTYRHSLGVASFIHQMLTGNGRTREYLEQSLREDSVSRGTLYAAALLHDIGKYIIREIIHDKRTKKQWARRVNRIRGAGMFDPKYLRPSVSEATFDQYVHERGIDPIGCLTLAESFPKRTLDKLERRGIPAKLTFREAIHLHEDGTHLLISRHADMGTVADIAAWHHSCVCHPVEALPYPVETSAVRIAVVQALHMVDILQALVSGLRSYIGQFDPWIALAIVIRDANTHGLDSGIAHAFVADQLETYSKWRLAANDPEVREARATVTRYVANG